MNRTTYVWALTYGEDQTTLDLFEQTDPAMWVELFVSNRVVQFVLLRIPGGYNLWDKALKWVHTKQTHLLSVPMDHAQLLRLQPDMRWLWDTEMR